MKNNAETVMLTDNGQRGTIRASKRRTHMDPIGIREWEAFVNDAVTNKKMDEHGEWVD
jgi:hypothetical protein